MARQYLQPIKWIGSIALAIFVFGLVFRPVSEQIIAEDIRNGVLIQAVPFVSIFITILLLFILLIVLASIRFNGKIPFRTYRPIEWTIIGGIVMGVVFLFQSWHFVGYRYGFVLLLGSTLGFILWSHITPANAKKDTTLPPFTTRQQVLGLVAGILVIFALTMSASAVNAPQTPYGLRQRVWDSYTPERQKEIEDKAISDFRSIEIPFLFVLNAFPGCIVFFATREAAGLLENKGDLAVEQT